MQGGPDAILYDTFNDRVYIFSHTAPHASAINAADGTVAGTLDLGGMPEQAVTDGKGVYVDIRYRDNVAVIEGMVMLSAVDGKILDSLPIGAGVDSAIFNPNSMETYSAQVDGTLTIIREKSPTTFEVEQTVQTKESAKQMAWDSKTGRILLVAADYGPPPARAPQGAPGGRGPRVSDSCSILVVTK